AVFALSVCIIGNAVTAWVSDYHGLLALRFMVGLLGAGLIYSMVLGLIGRVAHPDRVLALVIVAQILSMAGAMLIIPEIMARWQLPGVCLALALVFVSGFFCLGQLPSRFKPEATASDLAGAAFYPLLMLLCMLLFCAAIGGTWAFMERIGSAIGLPLDSIGQALAVGGLIGGLGALLAALLDLRWGRLLPLLSGLTLALLSALGLSKASGYWDYFSFQLLFSFCWNLCLPYMMGAIARVDKQGRFMVLVPATQAGGYAIGASLSGLLIGEGAPAYAGVVSALVFLVCAALLIPA
ncbi:MAG: hypothetical protein OIF38_03045, partial [Cellvibrionaceae bacterium]|nr:hypothetical protein [Cellvibrionaceae bacterium]